MFSQVIVSYAYCKVEKSDKLISEMDFSNSAASLPEKNQNLQSHNKRLREHLLQLYIQINTLSAISEEVGTPDDNPVSSRSHRNISSYTFSRSESLVIPGGACYAAAMDPKEENVALAALNGSITIVSDGLKQKEVLQAHEFGCRDVHWDSSGLISCGLDKKIKLWDVEKGSGQVICDTGALCHSVCGLAGDANLVFAAGGDQIFWIDKRRPTPITIAAGQSATSVSSFNNMLLYGGYDGFIDIMDRRMLQAGPVAHLELGGGPISSISHVLESGRCVAMTLNSSPQVLVIGDSVEQHELMIDPPSRFGCRADITDKNLVFEGDYATVCGGNMAVFCDGAIGSAPQVLENFGGFQYGAIFMTNISQKILTYSEDGVVSIWSLRER